MRKTEHKIAGRQVINKTQTINFMYNKLMERLSRQAQKIEELFDTRTHAAVGALAPNILIYQRLLAENESEFDGDSEEIRSERRRKLGELRAKLSSYKERLSLLGHQEPQAQEHQESSVVSNREENDFFERNTDKINDYINISSHSLNALARQKKLFQGTKEKIREGLQQMGLSDTVIDRISSRYLNDYRIFVGLLTLLIVLFIYVMVR